MSRLSPDLRGVTVAAPAAYTAHASGGTTVTSNAATDLDTTAAAVADLRTQLDALITSLKNADIIVS